MVAPTGFPILKSSEIKSFIMIAAHLVTYLVSSVYSVRFLVPFFLGSLSRHSFLRYSHSLHAVGGSEPRSGERFTVRRERRNRGTRGWEREVMVSEEGTSVASPITSLSPHIRPSLWSPVRHTRPSLVPHGRLRLGRMSRAKRPRVRR